MLAQWALKLLKTSCASDTWMVREMRIQKRRRSSILVTAVSPHWTIILRFPRYLGEHLQRRRKSHDAWTSRRRDVGQHSRARRARAAFSRTRKVARPAG